MSQELSAEAVRWLRGMAGDISMGRLTLSEAGTNIAERFGDNPLCRKATDFTRDVVRTLEQRAYR